MGREHFLAGIGGYRPDLIYNPIEDRCAVRFPGHDKAIAMLPSNTVDAVFTSRGVLTYRDSKGEIRALQVPDYEQIYQAAVVANAKENATGKALPFSQIMGRHTGGIVSGGMMSTELSGHGPYRSEGAKENMDDAVNRIVIGKDARMNDGSGNNMITTTEISVSSKDVYEKFSADLVREYIAPLVKNVQRLTALNAELASKVKEMERRLVDKPDQTTQSVSAAPSQDSPIREVSWGDQGGLPNFLHPQDNPFCGKRRG